MTENVTVTDAMLDEIEARAKAARPSEDWSRAGCSVVQSGGCMIVYDDGDYAAEVYGNLGLGIDERAIAEFWAHAVKDIPALIAALRASREREKRLAAMVIILLSQDSAEVFAAALRVEIDPLDPDVVTNDGVLAIARAALGEEAPHVA